MIGFVHIPKTGGSTMKFVLRNTFVFRHCDVRPVGNAARLRPAELAAARWIHPGLRSIGGHSLIHPTAMHPEVKFFTILRDPVKRIASGYAHHVRGLRGIRRGEKQMTLEEFVAQDKPGGFQTFQICGRDDPQEALRLLRDEYLAVGTTERFDDFLSVLAALSPYPLDIRYHKRNAAPEDDPVKREVLESPEMRAIIERANVSDRIVYDEVTRTIFPALMERARAVAGDRFGFKKPGEPGNLRALASRTYSRVVYRSLLKFRHAIGAKRGAAPPASSLSR
jgi:hypothetical protein